MYSFLKNKFDLYLRVYMVHGVRVRGPTRRGAHVRSPSGARSHDANAAVRVRVPVRTHATVATMLQRLHHK